MSKQRMGYCWCVYGEIREMEPLDPASPRVIPSYGGWTKFRGIPLDAWNINTFEQIGKACGGLEDISFNTWRKFDLTEAKLKIKDNYCGFIPATIEITPKQGDRFIVNTVAPANGKWITGKHPKIHGSFTREAAVRFDITNAMAEYFPVHENFDTAAQEYTSSHVSKTSIQMIEERNRQGKGIMVENEKIEAKTLQELSQKNEGEHNRLGLETLKRI